MHQLKSAYEFANRYIFVLKMSGTNYLQALKVVIDFAID